MSTNLGVMSCSKLLKHWKALSHILNSSKVDNRAILAPLCARRLHLSNYVNHRFDQFEDTDKRTHFNEKLEKGPSLHHFIANSGETIDNYEQVSVGERVPYLEEELYSGHGRKGTFYHTDAVKKNILNPYIIVFKALASILCKFLFLMCFMHYNSTCFEKKNLFSEGHITVN